MNKLPPILQPAYRVSNIELLDFFLEMAEEQGAIKEDDKVEVSADVGTHISSSIEMSYIHAVHVVQEIGYRLEWANHLKRHNKERPSENSERSSGKASKYSFYEGSDLLEKEIVHLNTQMYKSLLASSFTDLLDLFGVYLDFVHELCFIMKNNNKGITRGEIIKAKKLPKLNLEQKLNTIGDNYNFTHNYREELVSLYEARNRYTHSDSKFSPVPREKRNHIVKWLTKDMRYRRKNSSTWLSEEKASHPANLGHMHKIKLGNMKKKKEKRFLDDLGAPQLDELDIREICHFFIFIFDQYQQQLIECTKNWGFIPRSFEEYRYKINITFAEVNQ